MKRLPILIALSALMLAVPRHAMADAPSVQITSPASGASVRGVVIVTAVTQGSTTTVTFDWSKDGGTTWSIIGTDTDQSDGWNASWDTTGYDGPAVVRATATGGVESDSATVQVFVKNTSVWASPDPFSPNGDGVKDRTRVTVRLSEAASLSIEVRDSRGRVVKVLVAGFPGSKGRNTVVWKGAIDHNGRSVRASDGRYAIVASATDSMGRVADSLTHVVVDTRRPSFTWEGINPEPLRTTEPIRFTFRSLDPDGPLNVSFAVFDAVGRVRQMTGLVRRAGEEELDWTPRYANGGALIPGLYRVQFTATDRAGNGRASPFRSFRILRPVRSTVWRRVDGSGRRVALTFDDCNVRSAWSRILSVLQANTVHATFFCIGENVSRLADLARRTVREGNAVGDHTYDHAYLPGLSQSAVRRRLEIDEAIWWKVAGATPAPYFRPPDGAYDGTTLRAAGSVGYLRTIIWDVDPRDWSRPGPSAITARVLGAVHPGSIVVLHVLAQTAAALPAILRGLRKRRLRQSTLPELFHAAGSH